MAEVLGLVASSIAVTQLTSAIVTSGIKIKQLFDEVKDVPETIIYLIDHIETLASVLSAAKDEHREATSSNVLSCSDKSVEKSLQICQKALDHLTGLSKDLQEKIRSSHSLKRRIGKVKVVLSKDFLIKYERRLKLSLQILSLSQQTHMMELQRAQPDIIISRLSAMIRSEISSFQLDQSSGINQHAVISESIMRQALLATTTSNLCYVDSNALANTITSTRTTPPIEKQTGANSSADYPSSWPYANRKHTFKLGLASIMGLIEVDILQDPKFLHRLGNTQEKNTRALKSSKCCQSTPKFQVRLHIPRWLACKVWECAALQSTWGWTCHFRSYNIIDWKIFCHLVYGNDQAYEQKLGNIQNAFKNKQISIYDQIWWGGTLLHYCAMFEPQLCLFLIDQGADINMVDARGLKPLAYLNTLHPNSAASASRIQIYQHLLPSSELDEKHKIAILARFESRESWLYIQKQIWPDYYEPPNAGARLKVAKDMIWRTSRERAPETIKLALFGDSVPVSCDLNSLDALETSRISNNILSYLASEFGRLRARPKEDRAHKSLKEVETLQNLMRDIIFTYGFQYSRLPGTLQGYLKNSQLISLLQGFYRSSEISATKTFYSKVWDEAILPWLEFLEVCGIDLVKYGQCQYQEIELRQDRFESSYRDGEIEPHYYGRSIKARLINFKYGPGPLDWHFWWSEPTDEFAGEFWHLVESLCTDEQELWMPGAWVA